LRVFYSIKKGDPFEVIGGKKGRSERTKKNLSQRGGKKTGEGDINQEKGNLLSNYWGRGKEGLSGKGRGGSKKTRREMSRV